MLKKNHLNWAIIGTSSISEVMAHAIEKSQLGKLKAICSRSKEKGRAFAERFQIPEIYFDANTLLESNEIDVVYLGLPNHLHYEYILRCADAGKHILCEKPLVVAREEAVAVAGTTQAANVFCMEALMYRCHPFTQKIIEIMTSKVLGDIVHYQALYTANIASVANPAAGGAIRNLGCYPVSLIRLLNGAEPIVISGMGNIDQRTGNVQQASMTMKFADGCTANVFTADNLEMNWQFEIYGMLGVLKMITNPWLPNHENKLVIHLYDQEEPIEINFNVDKPLYSYQIDLCSESILAGKFFEH